MAFFVIEKFRFLQEGPFEFEPMTKAAAKEWICRIPSWKYKIEDELVLAELTEMVNRPPNHDDRLSVHELVGLGKDDQALLICLERPLPNSTSSDKARRVARHFRYGVLRGVESKQT